MSSCVYAGADLSALGVLLDLDGNARPVDGNRDGGAAYDIGACEFLPE